MIKTNNATLNLSGIYPSAKPMVLLIPVSHELPDTLDYTHGVAKKNKNLNRWEFFQFRNVFIINSKRYSAVGFNRFKKTHTDVFFPLSAEDYVILGTPEMKKRPDVVTLMNEIKESGSNVFFVYRETAKHAINSRKHEREFESERLAMSQKVSKTDIGFFESDSPVRVRVPQGYKIANIY